jgi:catalase
MVDKNLQLAFAALVLTGEPVFAQQTPLEVQIVDAMNKAFGVHPGFRANHAKGIVTEGSFKASPDAASLSKAALFSRDVVRVTVRFSDATGVPNIPDGSPDANPHGMAIKFHLADGSETNMVVNSLKFFPVSNGEDFRDLHLAIADSPRGAPKPTNFDRFLESHPNVTRAFATSQTPASFADEEYFGINAFVFVDKAGGRQAVRYLVEPEKVVHLTETDAAKQAPDFLVDELPTRLSRGPVTYRLKAQLAGPGDSTKDPSLPWPDTDKVVELGSLTIDRIVPNSIEAQKELLFLPGQLLEGIELSDDPVLAIRDGAYAESFSRRNP